MFLFIVTNLIISMHHFLLSCHKHQMNVAFGYMTDKKVKGLIAQQ